jgi:threonine synthase
MIRYISTRGKAPSLSFKEVVLAGLASDGGLYVPDSVPTFAPHELVAMQSLTYTELAQRVMQPFIGDAIPEKKLKSLIQETYKHFRHPAIAPLEQLGSNEFLLELFHGPTLAFKDFALQFLGRVIEYFIAQKKEKLTVIGATSGDTGSAAIEGCKGRKNMRIFILHPKDRVSDVQRKQMTSVNDKNVFNLAIKGSFDDCQNIVKALFADEAFRHKQHLTAVNSINWARILAQVVYYFYAALALGAPAKRISFSVPTGNFGDIYAGYIAKRMGLPIDKLIIATNSNDILARTLKSGTYGIGKVSATLSPSMDIQISSNFERLLFDLYDRDGAAIATMMQQFGTNKKLVLSKDALAKLRRDFAAGSADNATTLATIKNVYLESGELLDPHSAVGVHVAREHKDANTVMVTLATAHPAKFPDAVKKATRVHPALPQHLGGLMKLKERMHVVKGDVKTVKQFIESHS